eukprot:CAMPEP_0174918384 /NCGR_PEP_ID=MMETSP1355-20121228/3042_1 /TAXON_ID=464990 /ORGANISM="Hemiselmis tepida, Strain CCMP443" /LENGTH=480 /DNA_ID=CAMNT_0016163559 /DNA_START=29 /DNA_END=1468 /DNA_ORIENTATION=-
MTVPRDEAALMAHRKLQEEPEGRDGAPSSGNGGGDVEAGEAAAPRPVQPAGQPRLPWNVRTFNRLFPNHTYAVPLLFGCIITSMSATPGQSFFLGLYTERMMEEFSISGTQAAGLFSVAFVSSAVIVQFVGRFIDRFGATRVIQVSLPLFMAGLACLVTATNLWMVQYGYVSNRVLGVETIDLCSRVTINKWFARKRGRAMSLLGFVLGGQILCSGVFNSLMVEYGWRQATALVAVTSCAEILIGLSIIHNAPEDAGLAPDGVRPGSGGDTPAAQAAAAKAAKAAEDESFTFREAFSTPQAWVLIWVFFWPTIGWGGMNVHLVSICAEQGLGPSAVSVVYLAVGVVGTLSSIGMGVVIDRCISNDAKARAITIVPLLSACSLLLSSLINSLVVAVLFGVLTGLFVGAYQVAGFSMIATLYGRRNLGSIQAVYQAVGILGVAAGPLLMSKAREEFSSFGPALLGTACLVLSSVPLIATMPA